MGTISVPSRTLCLTLDVVNGDSCFLFLQKETGAKRLTMAIRLSIICFFCDGHLSCQVSRTLL